MTAMRSDMASASYWSWVTSTKVMPTACCSRRSSTCICSRSFLSSADSGSSSKQHLRPHDQRAGQRDALALAAGQLGGAALAEAGERHLRQRLVDAALLFHAVEPQPLQPVGDVLLDVEMREDGVALEHHVGRPAVGRECRPSAGRRWRSSRRSGCRSRRSSGAAWSCRSPTARAARRTRLRGWSASASSSALKAP